MKKRKIICPGVSKTGTCSLTAALKILGFDIVHYPHSETTKRECLVNGLGPVTAMAQHDGVSDLPAASYYQQLLFSYPDSIFIITHRDPVDWIESMRKHYIKNPPGNYNAVHDEFRIAMWGFSGFNAERLLMVYDMHYRSLTQFAYEFEVSHAWIRLDDENQWENLVLLINGAMGANLEIPDIPYPHINKS